MYLLFSNWVSRVVIRREFKESKRLVNLKFLLLFFFKDFFIFKDFFPASGKGETEGENPKQPPCCAQEPNAELNVMTHEIMTWAEITNT